MSRSLFTSLIADFTETLGLPELPMSEDGVYSLLFDEKYLVHMALNKEESHLVLFSPVGTVSPDSQARAAILSELLQSNGVAPENTIGLAADKETVLLSASQALESLEKAIFESWLARFIDMIEQWSHRLGEYATAGLSEEKPEKFQEERMHGWLSI